MKIGVIDIGSNSVRLALLADGKTLYKRLKTTRLGAGLSFGSELDAQAIERTAQAVFLFMREAEGDGAEKVYAFATAAVRSATNREVFLSRVKKLCGMEVEVISGEKEAALGILGALGGGDGGIIDVGGASTEVTVRQNGKTVYAKSVNIGTVRLHDLADRNREKLLNAIEDKLPEYGEFTCGGVKMYAIGGTASRLASIKHDLKIYRPEITDGTTLTLEEVEKLSEKLLTLSVEEIRATTICTKSADVVGGGCLLMYCLMKKFGISEVTVSEKDNIEGYYMYLGGAR